MSNRLLTREEWQATLVEAARSINEELGLAPEGFVAKTAYDISRDAFRTCISCGSATQPCCGQ